MMCIQYRTCTEWTNKNIKFDMYYMHLIKNIPFIHLLQKFTDDGSEIQ